MGYLPFLRDQSLLFEGTFSVSGCVQWKIHFKVVEAHQQGVYNETFDGETIGMQWKILQRRVPPLCLLVMSKSTHLAIDIYDISIINPAVIFFRPSLGFPAVFWDFRYFSEFSCGGREKTRILGVSCIFFLLEASSGGISDPSDISITIAKFGYPAREPLSLLNQ